MSAGISSLKMKLIKAASSEAREKFHSTTEEAAQIAHNAGVDKLMIGHFSGRYKDTRDLLIEARRIFPDTFAAEEGMVVSIPLKKMIE